MAQQQLAFSKETLIDISTDSMTDQTGEVTVSGSNLILPPHSSATYEYDYNYEKDLIKSSRLQFLFDVINSNTDASSRYNDEVYVKIYVQYWEEEYDEDGESTGYIEGFIDTDRVIPYFVHETKGYTNTYNINTDDYLIKSITYIYTNDSDNTVTFKEPRAYYSMTIIEAIDKYGGDAGQSGKDDPPAVETGLSWEVDGGGYVIDGAFKMYGILKKASSDEYDLRYVYLTFYGDDDEKGRVYTYLGTTILNNGEKWNIMGLRDGVLKCKIDYRKEGDPHYGEYWIHELRVVNCNPGSLVIESGHEINGLGDNKLIARMSPRPWINKVTSYAHQQNKNWISNNSEIKLNDCDAYIRVRLGNSVNGGDVILENDSGVQNTAFSSNDGSIELNAYGIYNGEIGITLESDRAIKDSADIGYFDRPDPMYVQDTLTITGCDHEIYLDSDVDVIDSVNGSATVYAVSDPPGVKVIRTQRTTSPFGWSINNLPALSRVGEVTGGDSSKNPQMIVAPSYPVGNVDETGTVSLEVEYLKGMYKRISKELSAKYSAPNEITIESSTGDNKILKYGAQLVLKVKNIGNELSLTVTGITLDTGTVTVGSYDRNQQTVTVTGGRIGKAAVVFTNNALQLVKQFEIENDYTEWIKTIAVDGVTDNKLVFKEPLSVATLKMLNWVNNMTPVFAASSIDNGTVTVGTYNTTAYSVTVTAQNKGKANIKITNSNLINWSIDIEVDNDYTDWLDSLNVVSSTGEFKVEVGDTIVLHIDGWKSISDNISINSNTTDGGAVTLGNWDRNNFNLSVKGKTAGRVILILQYVAWGFYREVPIDVFLRRPAYPDNNHWYAIWRSTSNKIMLGTFDGTQSKLTLDGNTLSADMAIPNLSQYDSIDSNGAWVKSGTWTDQDNIVSSRAVKIYASNLPCYAANGETINEPIEYNDIDMESINW